MRFRVTPHSPLIIDRWIDVVYGLFWSIYGAWGLTTLIVGLPTLTAASPDWYRVIWSGSVGILSAIAGIAAISLFFDTKVGFITKKKIERGAVIALGAFITLYPVLLFSSWFGGDTDRAAAAVLSLSYLLFPAYRIYLLNQRIKAYESTVKDMQDAS